MLKNDSEMFHNLNAEAIKDNKKDTFVDAFTEFITELDDIVYDWLNRLDNVTDAYVGIINTYADRNELNGTCFKDEVDIDNIEELNDTCYDEENMTSEEKGYYHNITREQQNTI